MSNLARNISKGSRRLIKKYTKNYYTKKYSKKYNGEGYSLITSNCIGGIINNRLGQPQCFWQVSFPEFGKKNSRIRQLENGENGKVSFWPEKFRNRHKPLQFFFSSSI